MNKKESYQFTYEVYDSADELSKEDAWLVNEAREVTSAAYAPYSNLMWVLLPGCNDIRPIDGQFIVAGLGAVDKKVML